MTHSRRRASTVLIAMMLASILLLALAPVSQGQTPDERSARGEQGETPGLSQLLRKAEREGSVRVIVRLRTDFVPEGRLDRPEVADQRDEIQGARAGLRADLRGTAHQVVREFETVPFIALEASPRALGAAQRSPRVADITEDRVNSALLSQSAPIVQAPTMWSNGYTGSGQTVAVLDTGVDSSHTFLAGKVVEEACYSGNSSCPNGTTTQTGAGSGAPCTYAASGCSHGTHVAGIAAGQGSFSGVAKGADVMAVQVFSRFTGANCGSGEDPCALSYTSDLIKGMERVYALRSTRSFSSVNMSLGGGRFFSNCDLEPAKAIIDNLRSAGIATVIASGNNGYVDSMSSPACISSAVSVGSTTKGDDVSGFSNSASFLSLLAPGSNINSSVPGGGFASFSGTSMATPHVAGAWALLKQEDPSASVATVLSALQSTGTPVLDSGNGLTKPRINVADAADLPVPRPANDDFANARALAGANATATGTNVDATKETGEPDHAGEAGGKSVWYSWTPQEGGTTTIETTGSNFDTLLAVYSGGAVGSLSRVASNDDAGGGSQSRVSFTATAGTTYRIAVDGYDAESGNIDLGLLSTTPPPDTTAPKVDRVVPAENATRIAPGANVNAYFSEAMTAGSIDSTTVQLFKKGATVPVAAAVGYDASTNKAVLNPDANLKRGARYKAVVGTGAQDLAGNGLDQTPSLSGGQPKQWFFTVRN